MTTGSDQVVSGLEGVLAFESTIAYIDGLAPEFLVRGYAVQDIAGRITYEEMCFLLWYDRLPDDGELSEFRAELAGLREAPGSVLDVLRSAPSSAHPMSVLRTAVSLLGILDGAAEDNSREANLRKATSLTAKMPTIVAAQARLQAGEEPVSPDHALGHAANYYYMLTGRAPDETTLNTFDTVLVLYAEHETNASTFASRVVVGTESDFYSAVVAGIGAVKGPLHGGAIDEAMRMLLEIGTADRAAAYVDDALGGPTKAARIRPSGVPGRRSSGHRAQGDGPDHGQRDR